MFLTPRSLVFSLQKGSCGVRNLRGHQSLRAVVTNYHRHLGLKQEFILLELWGLKLKLRGQQGHASPRNLRGEPSLASFSSWWLLGLCPHPPVYTAFPWPSLCHLLFCFLKDTHPWTSDPPQSRRTSLGDLYLHCVCKHSFQIRPYAEVPGGHIVGGRVGQ